MRVFICESKHKNVDYFIEANEACGNSMYEEDGCLYTTVLNDSRVWRAPDAVFRPMPSGLYRFDDDGRLVRVY